MPLIDVILIIILFGFIFYGLFAGLIRSLGVLVGVFVGAILASRLYLWVFDIIQPVFFGHDKVGLVLTFLLLFSIINKLTALAFFFIEKIFNIIAIIPFLKTINRLAGAIFGFMAGSLTIGLVLYVVSRYAILDAFLGQWLTASKMAPFFLRVAKLLLPLLPEILKQLKAVI